MKVYYDDEQYEIYGSYGSFNDAYFILWDGEEGEFFSAPIDECSAKKPSSYDML